MGNIPNSCVACPFESSCNTAMAFPDCHFYGARTERISLVTRLKNYLGKLFK